MPCRFRREQGFSILETLIASALLVCGVLALAQLFGLASALNVSARHRSIAALLAAQKLEELRTRSNPSAGTDFVDTQGRLLATNGLPPEGTAYVRRWTVEPSPADPLYGFVLQVTVAPAAAGPGGRDVRLVGARRRSP